MTLTNLVLDLISHSGHFVEETQWLIHPLIYHTEMSQNLEVERNGISSSTNTKNSYKF